MTDNEQTQEEGATPLEESQTSADAPTAEQSAEVEEAEGTTEAAADDQPTPEANSAETEEQQPPQPSKLEKAFARTKEENRQLKGQVRDLQNRIAEFEAAEINRTIEGLTKKHGLTEGQAEVLRRIGKPEELAAMAEKIKPIRPAAPMFGAVPRDAVNTPREVTVDSIPTFRRR